MSRQRLLKLIVIRFGLGFFVMGLVFFLTAGSINYWHAWIYIAILFVPMFVVLLYLLKRDPGLLERRTKLKERTPTQKLFITLSIPVYLLIYIIPGLDYRFHWSKVPIAIVILAGILVLLGYIIIFFVFRENSYASRVVDVVKGQQVISTGPYALVRHPMYFGALMMFIFSPLALGSFWAMIPLVFIPVIIVVRILDEENLLKKELPGYVEYTQKVKYRLIPKIW